MSPYISGRSGCGFLFVRVAVATEIVPRDALRRRGSNKWGWGKQL